MNRFAYKAIDSQGRILRGEAQAHDLTDLEARLRHMALDLISARPSRQVFSSFRGIPRRELLHFCFHLEQLVDSGVPLADALTDLRDSSEHARMKACIAALVDAIEGGKSLSAALEAQGSVFGPVFCALIRAGETSGRLPEVLREIIDALKREDELCAYIKRLTIYPAIVLCLILGAIVVAMLFVVPELGKLFASNGLALPLQTRLLIATSAFFRDYWALTLPAFAFGLAGLALLIARNAHAAYRWDALKLALPLVGMLQRKIILARFSSLFAMMYRSGITIMDTLNASREALGNRVLCEAIGRIEQDIAQGSKLSSAFSDSALFPPLVVRMLRIGEQTGALDRALHNLSYFYERDVRESVERLQLMLEPLLIVALGGLILWVAFSVLGPVYELITQLNF